MRKVGSIKTAKKDPIVGAAVNKLMAETAEETRIYVPSGSVVLNLACSNYFKHAFQAGRMVNFIGDSNTGKTYLALELLAQCAKTKTFKEHRLLYDDIEHALSMDIAGLFGTKLYDRLESPNGEEVGAYCSETVEDWEYNVMRALSHGPCVYITDSVDGLTSDQDNKKADDRFAAKQKELEEGKTTKLSGSYGMSKPKKFSEALPRICAKLDETDSFLVLISQTRDNIDPMSFEKKTRSGGKAIKFYASHEIWLAHIGKIKERDRVVGHNIRAKITKNKLTGLVREVEFSLRHGYGIDDIGACVDFLQAEAVIKKEKASLVWENPSNGQIYKGLRGKLLQQIESERVERDLFLHTQQTWQEIEEDIKPKRKPKYE